MEKSIKICLVFKCQVFFIAENNEVYTQYGAWQKLEEDKLLLTLMLLYNAIFAWLFLLHLQCFPHQETNTNALYKF